MSSIRFRLAKPSDAKQLANCHWHVRDRYSQGIFLTLGVSFLIAYYEVILDDPNEVVICAEREDGKIIGFCSATLDAEKQAANLRNHRLKLGLSAMLTIIRQPSLFKPVWDRYRSLSNNTNAPSFLHSKGARGEYWCWLKEEEDSMLSVDLLKARCSILYILGVTELYFEVDKFNKQVYKYHIKINKAEPIEEITLPDGRVRVLFRKILTK